MDVLVRIWSQIGIKDLFDILVVAFIIYQFLLIVQGTRAVQMIFGVVAFGAIYGAGQIYELYSLNWLLDHFFDSFFVIVVIIFQDQIRSGLASVGLKRKIFGGLTRQEFEAEVDEVAEVCGALSREKIGALIAFERSNGLLNYMMTGTRLDSNVNSDLLYSIFQSRSSLHDGAVIISKGLVAAAGCFLPLSRSVEVDKHMGTRHRAGLGLSELTDAAVVVVSEETGNINLCLRGEFHLCQNELDLRNKLKLVLMDLGPEGPGQGLSTHGTDKAQASPDQGGG